MQFSISEEIFESFPETRIGVIVATDMCNEGSENVIHELLENIQLETKSRFDIETLTNHPAIAVWRNAYSSFGSKPRDFRSSIESLVRSVLNGRDIRHINKLVDVYNYVSLKYAIPVGGEDLDKTSGNLYLKFSNGSEKFIPLGSDREDNTYKGEVIYCDDGGNVLCRRWNWRESNLTKLTETTKNSIVVAEGFDETVEKALEELAYLIEKFCSAKTQKFVANKNNRSIEW